MWLVETSIAKRMEVHGIDVEPTPQVQQRDQEIRILVALLRERDACAQRLSATQPDRQKLSAVTGPASAAGTGPTPEAGALSSGSSALLSHSIGVPGLGSVVLQIQVPSMMSSSAVTYELQPWTRIRPCCASSMAKPKPWAARRAHKLWDVD